MAHEIDLKKYEIHTDIVVETLSSKDKKGITNKRKTIDDIIIEETEITEEAHEIYHKKQGLYRTITFKDITDKDNFKKVEKVFISCLKKFLEKKNIPKSASCLVVGLGNEKSTPDSLGPLVTDNILVTSHLFDLGEVEKGYRKVSSFKPNVTGHTGIETHDYIKGIINVVKPDFIIVIDALASSSIVRLNKVIQITDAGISPGSGIGNIRKELNEKNLKVPVIAIGIPTVLDAVTIVNDTFKFMLKQFSYKITNRNNQKLKLIPENYQNYLNHDKELTKEEKEKLLGFVGTLEEKDFKTLVDEVLSPINYNLMVTVKEVDFIIEKLALLLSNGINKSLHDSYNTTNN